MTLIVLLLNLSMVGRSCNHAVKETMYDGMPDVLICQADWPAASSSMFRSQASRVTFAYFPFLMSDGTHLRSFSTSGSEVWVARTNEMECLNIG